jgi:hypothetical protein
MPLGGHAGLAGLAVCFRVCPSEPLTWSVHISLDAPSAIAAAARVQGVRAWWLRTVLVLQAPRPVFAALRDDSAAAAANRSEPVLLVILLSGAALAFASAASTKYHGLDFAAWIFFAGSLTGIAAYWGFGALVFGAARVLGSQGSYRRARHVLAFACVPLALSLAFAPGGHHLFRLVWFVFVAWAAALLVVGVRAVHGWTWARSVAAAVVPVAAAALMLLL